MPTTLTVQLRTSYFPVSRLQNFLGRFWVKIKGSVLWWNYKITGMGKIPIPVTMIRFGYVI